MASPLEGLRVVEMGQLIAIPAAMKMMADMGAQVIRLESCRRLESYRTDSLFQNDVTGDFWNKGANFYEQNRNKLGITLDLNHPTGLALLRQLISVSDIFAENFTPRVIKNFQLEYSDLQKLNPDIIMVSSTGYGFDGPWANFGATGPATEGASGLAYSTGYKNGPPVMSEIPYTDYTGAEHTIFAIMAALIHRQTTGDGQFIDVSQTETSTATIPEFLMDYSANKRVSSRNGNEDPSISPQGCYPCMGDDRWIVISITNDEEWASLCIELNNSELTSDTRFSTNEGRMKHKQDIDDLIGRETLQWDNQELMKVLQTAGVPAGAVLDGQELLFNEHLKSRNFYEIVPHHPTTGMPPLPYAGRPWQFSTTPQVEPKAAPIMGEHNKSIFIDLLGYDESILEEWESEGIIGYGPTSPISVRRPSLAEQVRQGRLQRFEPDFLNQVSNFHQDRR
ncbi:MAG: CoA transferase [Chloroflexota bacterium]|nr:CoA transferase [Chloroflexota bacterium]